MQPPSGPRPGFPGYPQGANPQQQGAYQGQQGHPQWPQGYPPAGHPQQVQHAQGYQQVPQGGQQYHQHQAGAGAVHAQRQQGVPPQAQQLSQQQILALQQHQQMQQQAADQAAKRARVDQTPQAPVQGAPAAAGRPALPPAAAAGQAQAQGSSIANQALLLLTQNIQNLQAAQRQAAQQQQQQQQQAAGAAAQAPGTLMGPPPARPPPPKPLRTEDDTWVLPKRGLQVALQAAGLDKNFKIEENSDIVTGIQELYTNMIENAVHFGCSNARRRGSNVLKPQDMAGYIANTWGITVPGVTAHPARTVKRGGNSETHQKRLVAVRNTNQQAGARDGGAGKDDGPAQNGASGGGAPE